MHFQKDNYFKVWEFWVQLTAVGHGCLNHTAAPLLWVFFSQSLEELSSFSAVKLWSEPAYETIDFIATILFGVKQMTSF